MKNSLAALAVKVTEFLDISKDGYGIYSANDTLQGCNRAFADIFHINHEVIINKTFSDIARIAFQNQQGIKIDSTDIEQWLDKANQLRRARDFRLFEVDLVDGRWFLFSEQTLPTGEMLVHAKDITKQKMLELDLSEHSRHLENLALTDELTQIANRRSFVESVNAEMSRCKRQGAEMAFLLMDIDYFKKINDTYGHPAGDMVLVNVAKLIKKTLREYDIFGRIGGEEFGIFLAETSHQTAFEVADRLRELVMRETFRSDDITFTITISFGISIASKECQLEQLYRDADDALYQAKEAGRNRVVIVDSCA